MELATDVLRLLSAYLPTLWVQVGSDSFFARVKPGDAVAVADDLRRTLLGWGCKAPSVVVYYVVGVEGAALMVSQVEDLPEGAFVLREGAPEHVFSGPEHVGSLIEGGPEEGQKGLLAAVRRAQTPMQFEAALIEATAGTPLGAAIEAQRVARAQAWAQYLALRKEVRRAANEGRSGDIDAALNKALDISNAWGFGPPDSAPKGG